MIRVLVAGVFTVTTVLPATAQSPQPNIVLIMADDFGYECLGVNGSVSYETPRLDRLAANGIRFRHCYSQPLCTPSRVQIMTGKYNQRNYTAFGVLDPGEVTFAHLLKRAGYATAIAGKWQLYGFDTRRYASGGAGTLPEAAGFDDYCLWQVTEPRSAGERYADPLISRKDGPARRFEGAYGPDVFTDFIIDWIADHRDGPYFVYYPMVLTHGPFVPTPDSPAWENSPHERDPAYFADMVAYTDRIVGRIADTIEALDSDRPTILLFTGDNGTPREITSRMQDGRTIKGGKGLPNDAGTHVPLIAYGPGWVPSGLVNDDLIDFSDFFATLADLSGATAPDNSVIDGRSFAPQLRGESGNPREWVYCHYEPHWGNWEPSRFARTHEYKLYGDGRYVAVTDDPHEEMLLFADELGPSATEARDRLERVLEAMR